MENVFEENCTGILKLHMEAMDKFSTVFTVINTYVSQYKKNIYA